MARTNNGCSGLDHTTSTASGMRADKQIRRITCLAESNDEEGISIGCLRTQTPDGYSLLVVRLSQTSYTTDLLICTHSGCGGSSMVQSGTSIICTCHGSAFSLTGQVLQGPAQTN